MNKVVHFEIPFDDKERFNTFYKEVFGWQINEMPEIGYTGLTTTPLDGNNMPKEAGSINGGAFKRDSDTSVPSKPVITIDVESIDEHAKKIEAAGGKMLVPKGEVPQMGYYAYFADSEGNVMGLWENM